MDEKTVLFDTVDKAVESVFAENMEHSLSNRSLDYLVIHHMEPDHSAALRLMLSRHPEATVVCNAKIEKINHQFFCADFAMKTLIVK